MADHHVYTMTISLNVLNHLGVNLYSNVPAVLSEVVANSYDADATRVDVTIDADAGTVTIADNGHGMTRAEVNERYLAVGYQRRADPSTARTPVLDRPVMGRKGIGKLSLFSVAEAVEVYAARNGEKSALRMSVPAIRAVLEGGGSADTYHPEPLDEDLVDFESGTRIVLRDLKKGIATASRALRTRLARRFSILGAQDQFQLFIGEREVTAEDRDYFHKLQYVWIYEVEEAAQPIKDRCTKAEKVSTVGGQQPELDTELEVAGSGDPVSINITGWIGTAHTAGSLKDADTRDNLNKISLIVRGKVAHEDLLDEFNESGVYASYLIGEIRADDLDVDDLDDIATSSRQRIVEDDPRFVLLKTWLRGEINRIGNQWTDLRNEEGVSTALNNPLIKEWFGSLQGNTRKKAVALFGKINQLTIDDESERTALFAQAVLGFETLRYRDNLDALDALEPGDIAAATSLFSDITDIQAALYHQIVQQRIEVIDKLSGHLEDDVLERVLQDHLFENLWLLDPGWERATDRKKEERIGAAFEAINEKLTEEEAGGRMDIRYKRTGGMNVIVELKRASVVVADHQIMAQVEKYRDAVRKYLDSIGSSEALEVVVVVGRDLKNWETTQKRTESIHALAQKGIRVVQYEKLLADAQAGYREYLDAQYELGRIQALLMALAERADPTSALPASGEDEGAGDEAPPPQSESDQTTASALA
jgi:hypothetical protein